MIISFVCLGILLIYYDLSCDKFVSFQSKFIFHCLQYDQVSKSYYYCIEINYHFLISEIMCVCVREYLCALPMSVLAHQPIRKCALLSFVTMNIIILRMERNSECRVTYWEQVVKALLTN